MSALTAHVALVSETTQVGFKELGPVAAAIQQQVVRDFGPLWDINATVDAFDSLDSVLVDYWPVILRDDINAPGAAGYHTDNQGQPFSLIQYDTGWALTASHETLEMLVDPYGNRTIAGNPPPQLPPDGPALEQALYLVEVCDPCEAIAYDVNGQSLSDFITPHYYDPDTGPAVRYSFSGQVTAPHTVLEGGYVSFGNPADNHWYQITVVDGQAQLNDLGVIQLQDGSSLREVVDGKVRQIRVEERYRIKPAGQKAFTGLTERTASAGATAGISPLPFARLSAARAKSLREYIKRLQ